MPFDIVYHSEVVDGDLPALPMNLRKRILGAIYARLGEAPERYGARLRRSLSGYWKLRVGDFRVVYEIQGSTVPRPW